MSTALQPALATLSTAAECLGPFVRVVVHRDAAGNVVRFVYHGDFDACSSPPTQYFDAAGHPLGAIGLRPVRDEADAKEIGARVAELSAGEPAETLGAGELLEALRAESTRAWSTGRELASVFERYEWLALAALRDWLRGVSAVGQLPRELAIPFEHVARGSEAELAGARRVFDRVEHLVLDELRQVLASAREAPSPEARTEALGLLAPWLGRMNAAELAKRLDAIEQRRALARRWRWLARGDLVSARPPPLPESTKGMRVMAELSHFGAYLAALAAWLRGDGPLPPEAGRHSPVREPMHPMELERGGRLVWGGPLGEPFLPAELAADLSRAERALAAAFSLASRQICDEPFRAEAKLHAVTVTDMKSGQTFGPFVGSTYEKNRAMEPVVSPCGRFVAFADNDLEDYGGAGQLRLFEISTGRALPLEEHAGLNALRAVSFSEDGGSVRAIELYSNALVAFEVATGRRLP